MVALVATSCSGAPASEPAQTQIEPHIARVSGVACNRDTVGNGVWVATDRVLTNAHVVAGASALDVTNAQGSTATATVVAFDPVRDLALLAPAGLTGSQAATERSSPDDTGAIAIMNDEREVDLVPYRVRRYINASIGDIYRQGEYERSALDIEADISPGMSGAGLFDPEGSLTGLVFAESRNLDAVVYAIDLPEIEAFLDALSATARSGDDAEPVDIGPCT